MIPHPSLRLGSILIAGLVLAACGSDGPGAAVGGLTTRQLTVTFLGAGSVASAPAVPQGSINCGVPDPMTSQPRTVCSLPVPVNTTIILTGRPESGSTFKGWSGDCPQTAPGNCIFPMDRDRTVTALFEASNTVMGDIAAIDTTNPVPDIITFNKDEPGTIRTRFPVVGLDAGDTVLSLDLRPSNNRVYALARNGTVGKLYDINPANGSAVRETLSGAALTLAANTIYSLDFNPQADALRIVGSNNDNFRVPFTGATALQPQTDAAISGLDAGDAIVETAYTNNYNLTPATGLFALGRSGTVYFIAAPNTGVAARVNASPNTLSLTQAVGFDISGNTTRANGDSFVLRPDATSATVLSRVNVATGALNDVGRIGNGTPVLTGMTFRSTISLPQRGDAYAVRLLKETFGTVTTVTQELITFNRTAPNAILTSSFLTGLRTDTGGGASQIEDVVGIDFRPAGDNALYGLSRKPLPKTSDCAANPQLNPARANVIRIATTTGVVSYEASDDAPRLDIVLGECDLGVGASEFGVDFQPSSRRTNRLNADRTAVAAASERFMVMTNNGVLLAVDLSANSNRPQLTATDPTPATRIARFLVERTSSGDVIPLRGTALAFTNSFGGSLGGARFIIDSGVNDLTQDVSTVNCAGTAPICHGSLGTVGFDVDSVNGYDIDPITDEGFGALRDNGVTSLYLVLRAGIDRDGDAPGTAGFGTEAGVDLLSGSAQRIGLIGDGADEIRGLALRTPQRPLVYGLTDNNRLVRFDPEAPNTLVDFTSGTASGTEASLGAALLPNEQIVGIDFLPSECKPGDCPLLALTSNGTTTATGTVGRLLRINVDATPTACTAGAAGPPVVASVCVLPSTVLASALSANPQDGTAPFTGFGPNNEFFAMDFDPASLLNQNGLVVADNRLNTVVSPPSPPGNNSSSAQLSVQASNGFVTTENSNFRYNNAPVPPALTSSAPTNPICEPAGGISATGFPAPQVGAAAFDFNFIPGAYTIVGLGALTIPITRTLHVMNGDDSRDCLFQANRVTGALTASNTLFTQTPTPPNTIPNATAQAGFDIVGGQNGLRLAAINTGGAQSALRQVRLGAMPTPPTPALATGICANGSTDAAPAACVIGSAALGTEQLRGLAIQLVPPANQ